MQESSPDIRDVLESIARDLENRAGNSTYQQAYKKAARLVRSYQRCRLYVPIQTDGTSQTGHSHLPNDVGRLARAEAGH